MAITVYRLLHCLLCFIALTKVGALKHTFIANHDGRFFIGPIGVPYGFLKEGIYSMSVAKFRMFSQSPHLKNKNKNQQMTDNDIMKEMEDLHPGFLLKRFENEAQFAQFQDEILDDPSKCGFAHLLDDIDERSYDKNNGESAIDDHVARGPGVVDGGAEGIFLSMRSPKQWKPNEPSVYHQFTIDEEGYYFLFYQVCLVGGDNNQKYFFKQIKSAFKLDFEYKNYDSFGRISFLSSGEMPLPHMFLYFTISYTCLLFLWVRRVHGNSEDGRRPAVYAIHHLMSSVLLLKLLTIFFESVRYHFIRVNGHAELWSFLYYFLNFAKGTFLFLVILLIGSGWSFFKPFLTKKERRVIYAVFLLQIIDNIAILALTHETMGEKLYNDWSAILHLVDIISCCAILVPIVWQVNSIEQTIEGTENAEKEDGEIDQDSSDRDTKQLQSKLALFRSFYLIVVAYIYFTRIVVYLFASTLSYNSTWLRYFISELGTLCFYFMIGVKFLPTFDNEYERVSGNDIEGSMKNPEQTIELTSTSK